MTARTRRMWRAAAFLVCVLWAAAAYSWVRTRSGPIGLDPGRMGLSFVRSATLFGWWPPWLILPSAWLVICLWCGNRCGPWVRVRCCPADGRALLIIGVVAWVFGCAAVESVLVADEMAFEREARAAAPGYRRERRWMPVYGELVWQESRGWCVDH